MIVPLTFYLCLLNNRLMKHLILTVFLILPVWLFSQTITISDARKKADGNEVTVEGIALNGSELGVIRYIQDTTGGVAVYDAGLINSKRGDKIKVTGTLKTWNNLLEISTVSNFEILSSNNPLPAAANKKAQTVFSEQYEGQLVTLTGITYTTVGTFSGNTNYKINQDGYIAEVRIDNNTNIPGTIIPVGKTNITGIMGQYKSTYQLLARDLSDLGFMNTSISVTDVQQESLTLAFSTEEDGTGIIRYGITQGLELGEEKESSVSKIHEVQISGLSPATFYYVKALSIRTSGDTVFSGIFYFSTASASSGNIIAYFNNPVDQSYALGEKAVYLNQSIDDTLAAYIKRATETIDMAMYNFNNNGLSVNIATALNNAHSRGVRVRVIGDGSTAGLGFDDLNGQIAVMKSPTSAGYKIMHNKFFVFDVNASNPNLPLVWTGSTNLTDGQVNRDPNNVIIVQDQALAKAYTIEFNEMWGGAGQYPNYMKSKFGPYKSDNTPHQFKVGDKMVECYFSPSDNVNAKIITALKSADASIYFATFVFTRTSIAYPIKDKYDQGVYVAGIFGDISGSNATAYDLLYSALGGNNIKEYNSGNIFHHKYAIVDHAITFEDLDPLVITGSHNWSASADNDNDENTLIVHDKTLASVYFQEWAQRFKDEGGTVFVSMQLEEDHFNNSSVTAGIKQNELFIHMYSTTNQTAVIRLTGMNGATVYRNKVQLMKGTNIIRKHIPELRQGLYILSIQSGFEQAGIKLMKQ